MLTRVFTLQEFRLYIDNYIINARPQRLNDALSLLKNASDDDFIVFLTGTYYADEKKLPDEGFEVELMIRSITLKDGTKYNIEFSKGADRLESPYNTAGMIFVNNNCIYSQVYDYDTITAFIFNNFEHVNILDITCMGIRFSITNPYPKPAQRGVIQNE